ncbi:MAG: sensor histidine kinase [Bacteroidetes bacterium]|nr:sensor histidine kinase [Bacteroidota bacterium]
MSKLDTWIDNRIVQNLFIWLCLFVIFVGAIQAENKVTAALFIIALLAPAAYINNLFVLPFFNKNNYTFAALFLVNTAVFTGIALVSISISLKQDFKWTMFLNLFGILILALTFGSAIKMARDSFVRRQQEKEAELKLLKGQLNPHFLFNTLNNLYGLSVVKSDKLPSLMLKLSDLLRYSLYETKDAFVPLEKEIQYLENYISLEKIRLEDTTDIQFSKTGNISSKYIAPMLLIVFVENAFKHLEASSSKKMKVVIAIKEEKNKLYFTCENTVDTMAIANENIEIGKSSGIGLKNVTKRLSLMYRDAHTLSIDKREEIFRVQLTLDL